MEAKENFQIIKEYLLDKQLTYGSMVTGVDVLEHAGIYPKQIKETDKCFSSELNDYYFELYLRRAEEIADEMMEHLRLFGFSPDKVHSKEDSDTIEPHIKGITVYTRWPWTPFYRARKAMQIAETSMNSDHTSSVDLKSFKEIVPSIYSAGMEYIKRKKERAVELIESNSDLRELFDDFQKQIIPKLSELKAVFRGLQPDNYGNYNVGGEDGNSNS